MEKALTATEELRRLLDERGVEYRTHGTTDRTWFEVGRTSWFIHERENGNLTADAVFLTPEQAIEATLGRGTCRNTYERGHFKCSECGHYTQARMVYRNGEPADPRYCPWCGRKVVDE